MGNTRALLLRTLISLVGAGLPAVCASAKTVCTVTINSANEANLFRKYAPAGTEFIELTEYSSNGQQNDWFSNACQSGIRCDTLVISGHFGSGFFGDTDFSLGLNELEAKACDRSCEGILNAPSEVFLFGCNTLASSERNARTPEEQYQRYIHAGYSPNESARLTAEVFGYTGISRTATMKRSFFGVPHVYGFSSTAPSGPRIAPSLKNYFKRADNKAWSIEHLEGKKNKLLASSLAGMNFTEIEGLKSWEDGGEPLQNICALRSEKSDQATKLAKITELLETGDFSMYLPAAEDLISGTFHGTLSDSSTEALEGLKGSEAARENFMNSLATLKNSDLLWSIRLDRAFIAWKLDWISDEELVSMEKEAFTYLFNGKITEAVASQVCAYTNKKEGESWEVPFKRSHLNHSLAWKALACMRASEWKDIAIGLLNKSAKVDDLRIEVMYYLARIGYKDTAFVKSVLGIYSDRKYSFEQRSEARKILMEIKSEDPEIHQFFTSSFLDNTDAFFRYEILKIMGGTLSNPRLKAEILKDMKAAVLDRGETSTYIQEAARAVARFDSLTGAEKALVRRMMARNSQVQSILSGKI